MENQTDLVTLKYKMPLFEIAYAFFGKLQSSSHGYATLNTTILKLMLFRLSFIEKMHQ